MKERKVVAVRVEYDDGADDLFLFVDATYRVHTNHDGGGTPARQRQEWDEHEIRWSSPKRPVREAS